MLHRSTRVYTTDHRTQYRRDDVRGSSGVPPTGTRYVRVWWIVAPKVAHPRIYRRYHTINPYWETHTHERDRTAKRVTKKKKNTGKPQWEFPTETPEPPISSRTAIVRTWPPITSKCKKPNFERVNRSFNAGKRFVLVVTQYYTPYLFTTRFTRIRLRRYCAPGPLLP